VEVIVSPGGNPTVFVLVIPGHWVPRQRASRLRTKLLGSRRNLVSKVYAARLHDVLLSTSLAFQFTYRWLSYIAAWAV